jgi:hypothetical protein
MARTPDENGKGDTKPAERTYLSTSHPRRGRETSDERRARERDKVANQQADLKREAAERRGK